MVNETKNSTVSTGSGKSKAEELVEAARRRNLAEQEAAENNGADGNTAEDEAAKEGMKDAAETLASIKPQAVAGSLAGIDVEAMGDVKGDGGDAKNYADNDPDKALGVPTYAHGLSEDTARGPYFAGTSVQDGEVGGDTRISKKTELELRRGREAISNKAAESRDIARRSRVSVTDATDDPTGEKGRIAAEQAAKAARAKPKK